MLKGKFKFSNKFKNVLEKAKNLIKKCLNMIKKVDFQQKKL